MTARPVHRSAGGHPGPRGRQLHRGALRRAAARRLRRRRHQDRGTRRWRPDAALGGHPRRRRDLVAVHRPQQALGRGRSAHDRGARAARPRSLGAPTSCSRTSDPDASPSSASTTHPQRRQPWCGAGARVRVRADGPARRGGRLRLDRRGRRRHPPHHRRPRSPARPVRDQPRRQPRVAVRGGRNARRAPRTVDQRQGTGGRRGHLRGGRRAHGVDDGRLRRRRGRARPQRRHVAGRRTGQRLPDRATAARSSSPATPTGVFARLCAAMGQPELASDPRYATHAARGTNAMDLDGRIARWTSTLDAEDLLTRLDGGRGPGRPRLHGAPTW